MVIALGESVSLCISNTPPDPAPFPGTPESLHAPHLYDAFFHLLSPGNTMGVRRAAVRPPVETLWAKSRRAEKAELYLLTAMIKARNAQQGKEGKVLPGHRLHPGSSLSLAPALLSLAQSPPPSSLSSPRGAPAPPPQHTPTGETLRGPPAPSFQTSPL